MAQRKHAHPGAKWWRFAAPIALVAAVAAFFLLRGDDPITPAKPKPKPSPQPAFEFTDVESAFVAVGIKTSRVKEAVRDEAASQVSTVMSTLYDAGFVTQREWGDGTFPTVLEQFAGKSADRAQRDLAELTLGPEAAGVAKVAPGDNALKISVLLSKTKEAVGAVASAEFEAEATLKAGGTFAIDHHAVFFLQPVGDAWKIVGWDLEGSLDSASPVATPTESPS